jgi:hydroxymethylpyrimidine/phosphomethylpyrimidine kinase
MAQNLLPLATVVTPNIQEAEELTGLEISDYASVLEAGRKLLELMGEGDRWVLIKGGHMPGNPVDVLVGKSTVRRYRSSRRPGEFRGTGCALASAIAGGLSIGKSVPEAVKRARKMLIGWMDKAPIISGVPRCLRP